MNERNDQGTREGRRDQLKLNPADELSVTLWCLAVVLAVLLGAYWLAAAIYS